MGEFALSEGELMWEPSQAVKDAAGLTRYMKWLEKNKGHKFSNYDELWQWSVDDIEGFWASLWEYFDIKASKPYTKVLSSQKMPGARWFEGAELNYAEHVFRNKTADQPAIKFQSETTPLTEISWDELEKTVASIAAWLKKQGVSRGDRVAAYIPNIPQTIAAFLACASIGAVWSSCSPDFGTKSVIDRFAQIEPKVLFAVNGYCYGGKMFDCRPTIAELGESLPTVEKVVLVPSIELEGDFDGLDAVPWDELLAGNEPLAFEQVPFNHPMWVVYSSGTTGLPKGLVHSQGGVLLEFMKFLNLHVNLQKGDTFFWFSTTGWVMWNILQGSMLIGVTPLVFDGNPGYPDMDVLWDLAERAKVTTYGTSPAFVGACMKLGLAPNQKHDLSAIKGIGITGSPMPPEGFKWLYDNVNENLHVGSTSGGTDVATGFLCACALKPVHAGELQCRGLGVKAEAWDEDGNPVVGQVGELVIANPMPSMPLYLWNDKDNLRYVDSYFDVYPGVWRHGDWVRFTPEGGGYIEGRSDSTLNRQGVRMGSSDIYRAVEELDEVSDSLVVGYEKPGGDYYMPLFVVLKEGLSLDDDLKKTINVKIRGTLTPRHVPDEIYQIDEVPMTLNGKKMEVPVKKILAGAQVAKAANVDSMANPGSIQFFSDLAGRLNK